MSEPGNEVERRGTDREVYWRTKLRRLRFGAEPLSAQVARYRRVTVVLTAIVGGVAVMFLMIFAAFRRPDVALILDAIVFVPIVVLAWLDYRSLASNVRAYETERARQATFRGNGTGDA